MRLTPDDYLDFSLAPCPKCGSRAEHRDEGPHSFYAVCEYNCVRQVGTFGTKAASAAAWNSRPLADKLESIFKDARAAVGKLLNTPTDRKIDPT